MTTKATKSAMAVLVWLAMVTAVYCAPSKPVAPTPTVLPVKPAPGAVRAVDPNAEKVVWRTRSTTAPALDPFAGPTARKAWWSRSTTASGAWTLVLRGPDGKEHAVDRAALAIPAGWHAELTVRLSVALVKDANEPVEVRP